MAIDDRTARFRAGQLAALGALLTGASTEQAAAACHRSVRTVRRWQAEPGFADALRTEARRAAAEGVSLLLASQREAVAVLRREMQGGTSASRIRAARALLEVGQRVASDDLDQRLSELERRTTTWAGESSSARGSMPLRSV